MTASVASSGTLAKVKLTVKVFFPRNSSIGKAKITIHAVSPPSKLS